MGLSAAERNMLGVLSQITGCCRVIRDNYDSHSARMLTDVTVKLCGQALAEICPVITVKDALIMQRSMEAVQAQSPSNVAQAATMTSLCLALLSDVLDKVRNPRRRKVLTEINYQLLRMHRYFDRKGDRDENYNKAGLMADAWNGAMGCR